jgi:hypothetical protein
MYVKRRLPFQRVKKIGLNVESSSIEEIKILEDSI